MLSLLEIWLLRGNCISENAFLGSIGATIEIRMASSDVFTGDGQRNLLVPGGIFPHSQQGKINEEKRTDERKVQRKLILCHESFLQMSLFVMTS